MIWVFIIIFGLLFVFGLISFINRLYFFSLFKKGNCLVTGLRGCGKDMAFCLAINHFKKNYISNVEYSSSKKRYKHFEFSEKVWELAGNSYENFADSDLRHYEYPYPDGIDYYISDAGVYFPAQYATQLVKKYKGAPLFQALSRHLGDCNVHVNSQKCARVWDKIREQSDIYIRMRGCKVFFGRFAFLRGAVYENSESCDNGLIPPRFGLGKDGKTRRVMWETSHGRVRTFWFISKIPYRYDDRRFKRLLDNRCIGYGD